jgi:hypothetical protein
LTLLNRRPEFKTKGIVIKVLNPIRPAREISTIIDFMNFVFKVSTLQNIITIYSIIRYRKSNAIALKLFPILLWLGLHMIEN